MSGDPSVKVIVLDKGKELYKIVSLYVESEFETNVLHYESPNSIDDSENIDLKEALFVCDYTFILNFQSDFKSLGAKGYNRSFIILEDSLLFGDEEKREIETLLKEFKHSFCHRDLIKNQFVEMIEGMCGAAIPKVDLKYSKMSMDYFFKSKHALVDTYIKIGAEKFIKIVNRGDDVPEEVLEHITKKGVRFFYVKKVDFKECYRSIVDSLSERSSTKKGVEGSLTEQFTSIENVHTALKSLGVSEEVLEIADETVEIAKKTIQEQANLPAFLKEFLKNENYISELSTLTSYLAISCLSELPWGNPKNFTKFALASIIQDVALNDEELAKICHLDSEEFKNLNEADKTKVVEHPSKAVEILDNLEGMDQDIKDIVMQHHERPHGKGFPWGLKDNEINPLSNLYIICHEYAHRIITGGLNLANMKKIDQDFREMFSSGNYAKPYKAFLEVFRSKR